MLSKIRKAPEPTLDRRGYKRSPVTLPSYRKGQPSVNKGKRFPIEPPTPAEVYALMDQCEDTATGRRNLAIIQCFWRTGLRCSELIALVPKDVDLERGKVTVLHGKGDKRRVAAIDSQACGWLREWEAERVELGLTRLQPYFPVLNGPTRGQPLHDAYLRELVKLLARKAGIEGRMHPHALRHAHASFLLDADVPLSHIRAQLGHSSISVTARYADHVNPATVLRAMREVQWPDAG
jgi:integrase/recombinase XerC